VGLSRNDWVAAHAPELEGPRAAELTCVGAVLGDPRWRGLAAKVRAGAAGVEVAAVIVRLHEDLAGVADRAHLDAVVDAIVDQVEVLGTRQVRRLARQAKASLRPAGEVEDEAARLRAGRLLSRIGRAAGLVEYRLRLDPEGAALLDAAIDPLARPRPDLDWSGHPQPDRHPVCGHPTTSNVSSNQAVDRHSLEGHCVEGCRVEGYCVAGHPCCNLGCDAAGDSKCEHDCDPCCGSGAGASGGASGDPCRDLGRDPRHPACGSCAAPVADPRRPGTRRADALLELVARAVAAPQGVTRTPRTKLVVTMSHDALLGRIRGAGVAGNDEVLTAGTVRRVACEAQLIPMVLGGPSQVLDLGFRERYFTPGQRLALGARDGGCSYPGCSVPPQWCEAHHITHWTRGGRTSLLNTALLCRRRHHTHVHRHDLTATATATGVTWHL
jgi:hypothetical protein